jgi:hypothetical protein
LLRQLFAGLPPLRSGFDPKPIYRGYVVDNMALGQTSHQAGLLYFLLLVTFHQYSILIFIFILLLLEEQPGKTRKLQKSDAFSDPYGHFNLNAILSDPPILRFILPTFQPFNSITYKSMFMLMIQMSAFGEVV